MAETPDTIEWFLGREGQQYGPLKNVELRKLVELGHLREADLLWRQGFAEWRPAREVGEELLAEQPVEPSTSPAPVQPAAVAAVASDPIRPNAMVSPNSSSPDLTTPSVARADARGPAADPAPAETASTGTAGSFHDHFRSIEPSQGQSFAASAPVVQTPPAAAEGKSLSEVEARLAGVAADGSQIGDFAPQSDRAGPHADHARQSVQRLPASQPEFQSSAHSASIASPYLETDEWRADGVQSGAERATELRHPPDSRRDADFLSIHEPRRQSFQPEASSRSMRPEPDIPVDRAPVVNRTAGAEPAATDTAEPERRRKKTRPRSQPPLGRRLRRVAAVVGLPVLIAGLAAAAYLYRDSLFTVAANSSQRISSLVVSGPAGDQSTAVPSARPAARPSTRSAARSASTLLAGNAIWARVQSEFPEWHLERMREADRMLADKRDDASVEKYLSEALVTLRRGHASDAFAATPDKIRNIAQAFVENLGQLKQHSVAACYNFISNGEASSGILQISKEPVVSQSIERQSNAVFDAIAEGRRQPQTHLPPRKTDYDVLSDELVKKGWSDNDLQIFSDPRLLSRAPSEKVCKLVEDWFNAHLSIADPGIQLRLLIESLKPVVSG